ncbi:MAG: hypothetical protein IJ481_02595 [Alphaproteobacteria bacterium]|nr:hypothetical protein [Alphaproteobacteria bacterium]
MFSETINAGTEIEDIKNTISILQNKLENIEKSKTKDTDDKSNKNKAYVEKINNIRSKLLDDIEIHLNDLKDLTFYGLGSKLAILKINLPILKYIIKEDKLIKDIERSLTDLCNSENILIQNLESNIQIIRMTIFYMLQQQNGIIYKILDVDPSHQMPSKEVLHILQDSLYTLCESISNNSCDKIKFLMSTISQGTFHNKQNFPINVVKNIIQKMLEYFSGIYSDLNKQDNEFLRNFDSLENDINGLIKIIQDNSKSSKLSEEEKNKENLLKDFLNEFILQMQEDKKNLINAKGKVDNCYNIVNQLKTIIDVD